MQRLKFNKGIAKKRRVWNLEKLDEKNNVFKEIIEKIEKGVTSLIL